MTDGPRTKYTAQPMKRLIATVVLSSLAACAHREAPAKEAPMNEQSLAPWNRLSVADGSANGYRFTRDAAGKVQFVYDPVTAAESSSGMYSGGAPRQEELEPNDARLTELWALLEKLEADKAKHTPDRARGTAAISWESPSGTREFIIPMGADSSALMAVLKRFGR